MELVGGFFKSIGDLFNGLINFILFIIFVSILQSYGFVRSIIVTLALLLMWLLIGTRSSELMTAIYILGILGAAAIYSWDYQRRLKLEPQKDTEEE